MLCCWADLAVHVGHRCMAIVSVNPAQQRSLQADRGFSAAKCHTGALHPDCRHIRVRCRVDSPGAGGDRQYITEFVSEPDAAADASYRGTQAQAAR